MKLPASTQIQTHDAEEQRVLLDQQLALGAYLNALLTLAPEAQPEAEPEPPPALVETMQEPAPIVAPGPVAPPVAAPGSAPDPDPVPAPATAVQPDWAEDEFQCLLFQVAGLTLAVPLARLSGVLPWDDEAVTAMPNHSAWFLGLREHQGLRARLIDVAAVVLPADKYADLAPADSARLGNVVMIDDNRWGLACDAVGEVITLKQDAVKWRTEMSRRPWLAGTVIEHMCALLDTDALARMLAAAGAETG